MACRLLTRAVKAACPIAVNGCRLERAVGQPWTISTQLIRDRTLPILVLSGIMSPVSMDAIFLEAVVFTQVVEEYFGGDEAYSAFQLFLIQSPESGRVISGCGGLRKVRWPDPRRGKGKRGGLRIIYLHIPEAQRFFMLDVYDKDEAEDLSRADRTRLAQLAADYRETVLAKLPKRGRAR
jgi:hypothetical protein